MAIKDLKKLSIQKSEDSSENEYLSKAENFHKNSFDLNLSQMTLDKLADTYIEIDRQSHLLKGRILLEARSRFKSDKEFGKWVSTRKLFLGTTRHRTNLMNLASLFKTEEELESVGLTVAYKISAPKYQSVASSVYSEVKGQSLSVIQVVGILEDKLKLDQSDSEQNHIKPTKLIEKKSSNSSQSNIKTPDDLLKLLLAQMSIKEVENLLKQTLKLANEYQ